MLSVWLIKKKKNQWAVLSYSCGSNSWLGYQELGLSHACVKPLDGLLDE